MRVSMTQLHRWPMDDPDDDLNISQTASVCSACHDETPAKDHMKLNGASFHALDDDIH